MPDPVTIANAVGWGISLLGWVISPIVSKVVTKGLSYLEDVTGSSAKNLQNLEKKVLQLKMMLEAAQAVPPGAVKAKLEGWAEELKSAFYDAEDILDAIDYHHLKCKALFRRRSANTTKKKAKPKEFNVPNESKQELRKTLKRIEDLIDEGQKLLQLLHFTTSGDNIKSSPTHNTGSLSESSNKISEPPKVFGRDEELEKIRSMLRRPTADHSVIGIYGIPGSGKTTLAKFVFECEKNSEDSYFELTMWIHVTKNFSVHTVYNEMLEMVSGPQKEKFSNLDRLHSELKNKLKDKRLLLVLDDVWYSESAHKRDDLKNLLSPLKEADTRSRVLVTSRTADAAKFLGAGDPMLIPDMKEEEFFKMFMHYALDNSAVGDQDKGEFETIGRKISLLLRKSPLAVTAVAQQLRLRTCRVEDIDFWRNTLNQSDLLKDTMGALWWSYHQLDEYVRQCFAYCSMFPRRYDLRRDELIKMWVAQGFGDTSKNPDMEVAARECFEVLLSTSFIQLKPKQTDDDQQDYYTVHDLLHDLAQSVAGSDCFRIEKDTVDHQIPQDVRHLFVDSNNLGEFKEQIMKLGTLRTLVLSRPATEITAEEFKRMLKDLKKLRFLSVWLETFGANVIPECIGELKHLRYLRFIGFSSDGGIDLPPTFTQLYHLQHISVTDELRCPDGYHMADLENLRHIGAHKVSIPEIGRMTWLQTLNAFVVKKKKGYEITQLENLNNIRGKLRIRGLGNIQSKEDARRANLSNKLHISVLTFNWAPYDDEGTESSSRKKEKTAGHRQQEVTPEPEEILEALHPPALLVELDIVNYGGSVFPSWLSGEDGKPKHLKRLSFQNCQGSGSQLKFSKPLPELHRLEIRGCSWNALPDNIEQLASLKELSISSCENIKSTPRLPSSLKILVILFFPNISTLPELPPSLEILVVRNCRNIKSLPGLPSSLKELLLSDFPNICTLPELPPSLEELQVRDCPNIKSLPGLPPSLEKLWCEQYLVDSYPDRQALGRIKIKIGYTEPITTVYIEQFAYQ